MKTPLKATLMVIGALPLLVNGEEEPVYELSAFLVETETTRGYLSTNSVTATGFNMENYKVPLNISVVTEAFLEDLAVTDLGDVTDYMAGVQRGTEERQGTSFFIRGFQTAYYNRNGIRRYHLSGTDNIKQMEVLKGPNAVFYGQTAPGGIINYVSKRPEFNEEYVLTVRAGENAEKYGAVEAQGPLWDNKIAYRIMGSYEDSEGWQEWTFRERSFIYGGLRIRPIQQLDIYIEYEKTDDLTNHGGFVPMGNREYMAQYANPPEELKEYVMGTSPVITEANIDRILGIRWLDIDSWRFDYQQVYGMLPPKNVDFMPEATPWGDAFNHWGPGGSVDAQLETYSMEAFYQPKDWVSLRAVVLWDERYQPALTNIRYHIRGDGSIQVRPQGFWGLYNDTRQIKLESIVRAEFLGYHNFVLGYGQFDDRYHFMTQRFKPIGGIPWYENWQPFTDPVFDLRDALSSEEVFFLDGSESVQKSYYLNITSEFFDGKVHTLMGFRREVFNRDSIRPDGEVFSTSPEYEEDTPMIGATWEFKEGFSLFASYSQSARPSTAGGQVVGPGATDEELSAGAPPRIGKGTDFGLKASWRDNLISGTLSAFEVTSENEQSVNDREATDSDPRNLDDDPNNNVIINRAGGLSRSRGIELEAVYTPSNNFQATLQYTWLAEADIVDDPINPALNNQRLQNAPEHSFGFWNKYTFSEGRFEGFTLGGGGRYTDAYNAQGPTSPNQYELPSYWAFDAMLRYEFEWKGADVSLTLNIKNLLDKRYYEGPPSRLGDPRTLRFTARISF